MQKIKYTKTLQYRDRILSIPFLKIPKSPLCPVAAISNMLKQRPHIPTSAPLASYPVSGKKYKFFTHSSFENYLKKALTMVGQPSHAYSGHSFRRGGASFACSCGVPSDLIKIQGDWSLDAYLRYLSSPCLIDRNCSTLWHKKFQKFKSFGDLWGFGLLPPKRIGGPHLSKKIPQNIYILSLSSLPLNYIHTSLSVN